MFNFSNLSDYEFELLCRDDEYRHVTIGGVHNVIF